MTGLRDFARAHPQLAAFIGLAVAMVTVVLIAAKDVTLGPGQRATLVISTIVLAGLCVWIISWE